ncbi:EAL domain-containing protein [Microbacterium sp. NPDC077184]|uniref:EAL domain-containing protein n=1 Tax=Microbacterium sp. NPDC077184 TaxID=3154764 RepID=UPI0034277736
MTRTAEMSDALQGAVDRGEMVPWFQPQYDLRTYRLVGAEVLCRWDHPEWGLVRPNDFIPLAEEIGVIDEIGQCMTEHALEAIGEWNIDISVNVSPVQLQDAEFTSWLEGALSRARHPAKRLTVEITEGRDLGDVPPLVARLDRLRRHGVGIAIDDFGAGHASLAQARRLHATELKIDRHLTGDDSPATTAQIAAAVAFARDAELRTVAEGVETTAQLHRVRQLGCDRGQGYLWSRPVPRDEMAHMIATA